MGNNCEHKHLMKWKHGNTVLVNWLYWKFFWYSASNAQLIEETQSQMALVSLGNRSLTSKWLTYLCVLEGRNQKKKTFAMVSDSLPVKHQHKSLFLQPANNTQRDCRGERVTEDHRWNESVYTFCWRHSALSGPSRLKKPLSIIFNGFSSVQPIGWLFTTSQSCQVPSMSVLKAMPRT